MPAGRDREAERLVAEKTARQKADKQSARRNASDRIDRLRREANRLVPLALAKVEKGGGTPQVVQVTVEVRGILGKSRKKRSYRAWGIPGACRLLSNGQITPLHQGDAYTVDSYAAQVSSIHQMWSERPWSSDISDPIPKLEALVAGLQALADRQ